MNGDSVETVDDEVDYWRGKLAGSWEAAVVAAAIDGVNKRGILISLWREKRNGRERD